MEQDKALRKVLQSASTPSLPVDFNQVLMQKIELELERNQQKSYKISLIITSICSLMLIGLGIYLLKDKLSILFSFQLPVVKVTHVHFVTMGFFIYISLLIFILLAIDSYLRNLRQKKFH